MITKPVVSDFLPDYFHGSPAFAAIAPLAQGLAWRDWPEAARYYSDLNTLGAPLRFVQDSPAQSYELYIGETAQVPTRHALWHDYFNALVWCRFPQTKSQLNALHRAHWDAAGPAVQRTPVRDGLTLLDESGALVICDDASLLDLLREMNWPELFVAQRARVVRHMRVIVFGHGLLEKFLHPYVGMTAKALLMPASAEVVRMPLMALCAWADAHLAAQLHSSGQLVSADLCPLPILGVPGWWPANEEPAFYDNEQYFRRQRRRRPK
ncbi:DUF3025 domain-containing protein [Uliginosibacterium sp. H3]|uniref:DUF3025 domain-containing protein n=1 Tax=Uliginosibacterium silvisoli TaxID=3114758 RepID=A0ABU6K0Y3_9RHOO|nr:DUF3025 domain-containing protein [Uliginosibacterium sp. H3]